MVKEHYEHRKVIDALLEAEQENTSAPDFHEELKHRLEAQDLSVEGIKRALVAGTPSTIIYIHTPGHGELNRILFIVEKRRGGYHARTSIEDSRAALRAGKDMAYGSVKRYDAPLPDVDAIVAFITKWSKVAIDIGAEQLKIKS